MSKHILVIDDEAAIRKSFQLALEDCPVLVDTAASGNEGLTMATARRYDVIYLDLKMPGLNGVETLKRLRARDADIPIYIITAFYPEFLDQLKSEAVQRLGFELLRKPIGSEDIVSLTMEILNGPGALGAAEAPICTV